MTPDAAREKFTTARSAHLATADSSGTPHLVPIVFALHSNQIAFAIDHKPKRTQNLRRLRNIAQNDRVSVLVDHYDEDWTQLWWSRADGRATISHDPPAQWLTRLTTRYPQYAETPPQGPLVLITVERWQGWSYQAAGHDGVPR
ncbi:TIGR03668 family PPOX class F420-dependent oxidoreductase [Acrocarpospora catenulata]|uniref:TIGR03668 family PPOX class F420-dependent oxidoreductase n=1 Tax=Acrocarpospora catenulata TaxID=2836182 RepID=UPI001BD97514|nr:TIGR03668 family PPOX class F420-dependent oxidoreductase [Acrocarpospora catenulata]